MSLDSMIEYYEIIETTRALTVEENQNLKLMLALREYKNNEIIPVPNNISSADEFFDWLKGKMES